MTLVTGPRNLTVPQADPNTTFTGERFVPGLSGEIEVEHLHRYVLTAPLCAGRDVLDIASGQGYGSAILAQEARSVVGVEIDTATVARARELYSNPNLTFKAGSCTDLPAKDRSVDVVVSFETIEHIAEQEQFLAEIRRVLRDDGMLVISTPDKIVYNSQTMKSNQNHVRELTREEFEELLKKYFGHVTLSGQRTVFGSALVTEGTEQASLVFANQGTDHLVSMSNTLPDATYLIAVCTNAAVPASLGNSFFQCLIKANHFSALEGGIRERDEKIIALREHVRFSEDKDRQKRPMPGRKLEEVEWLRYQIQGRETETTQLREQIREFTTNLSSLQQQTSASEVDWLRQQIQDRAEEVARSHEAEIRVMVEQLAAARHVLEVALQASWPYLIRSVLRWGAQKARKLLSLPGRARKLVEKVMRRLRCYSPVVWQQARLLRASGLFDAEYYLLRSPDLAQSRIDLAIHYLVAGAAEGRDPHPVFSTTFYQEKNRAVAAAGLNPLLHFLKIGAAEGRDPHPLFDIAFYRERNQDGISGNSNPLIHYLTVGAAEKRDPHPLFSTSWYVQHNADVAATGSNPLAHYLMYGAAEGRDPHPLFKSANYVAHNPDAAGAPLLHYLKTSASEVDLAGTELFDPAFYRLWNHDPKAQQDPLKHYLTQVVSPATGAPSPARLEELVETANRFAPVNTADKEPVVSIIIPVHNQVYYTLNCLVSLRKQQTKFAYEILVVDDCSSDETALFVPRVAGVRYLRNKDNLGFLRSCNGAAGEAVGQYFLFLNNDTCVLPGWLDELLQVFEAVPGAGLVGSKLIYPSGRLQEAGGIIYQDGSGWNYGRNDSRHKPEYNFLREVDYCSGASIVVPRQLWNQLGGFDEVYAPAYYEDADLAFRIRDAGYKVLYQPLSQVVHFEGVSCGTDTSKGVKAYQVVNARTFAARHLKQLTLQPRPGVSPDIACDREKCGRILFVDVVTPTPDQDAGSLVTVELLRTFQQLGYQPVFAANDLGAPAGYADDLRRQGVEFLHHPMVRSVESHLTQAGRNYAAIMLIRESIANQHLETIRRLAPQARVIFHTIDLHHVRERREADLCHSEELAVTANNTKIRELAMVQAADATVVVSQFEKDYLNTVVPGANVTCIPFVKEAVGSRGSFGERCDILFVGGYRHPPNVDAVCSFVKSIFPRVRAALPQVRLLVIGSNAPAEVTALDGQGVEVIGYVQDLAPYFDRCRLTVAPLRFGAGIKGKVVDSMSYGVPSVVTDVAAEGMGLRHGREVLIAMTDEEFADAVVRLYTDESLWHKLSAGGLAFVERMYSRDAGRRHVHDLLTSIGLRSSVERVHNPQFDRVSPPKRRAA